MITGIFAFALLGSFTQFLFYDCQSMHKGIW